MDVLQYKRIKQIPKTTSTYTSCWFCQISLAHLLKSFHPSWPQLALNLIMKHFYKSVTNHCSPMVTLWGAASLSTGSILINNVAVSLCVISIDRPCTEQAASYWLGFRSAMCVDATQSLIAVETWELLKREALALQRDLRCLSGSLMIVSLQPCHQIVRKEEGMNKKKILKRQRVKQIILLILGKRGKDQQKSEEVRKSLLTTILQIWESSCCDKEGIEMYITATMLL